jgi:hypothetical protein
MINQKFHFIFNFKNYMIYNGLNQEEYIEDDFTEEDVRQHRLIPIILNYNNSDNVWTMKTEEYVNGSFKCTDDRLKRVLKKMRAKDSIKLPLSRKKVTYQMMIDEIKNNKYNRIYAWKSKIPTDLESMKELYLK